MNFFDYYFSPYSSLTPFPLFQAPHFIALGLLIAFNVFIIQWGRRQPDARPTIRKGMALLIVLNVLAWQVWHVVYGFWDIRYILPLHICGLLQWLSCALYLTRKPRLYEFIYFLGLAGATQALITPDSGNMAFPHFRAIETMIGHGTIVTTALYFTFVEGYRPTWESVKRVIVSTQLYAIAIFFFNQLIGSNYMFLARKPDVPSLIDVLGPWPLYIVPLELIAFTLIFLLYLPWAIKDRQVRAVTTSSP